MPNAAAAASPHALGADRAGAIDVDAACTGFLSALALGAALVESGRAEHVLVDRRRRRSAASPTRPTAAPRRCSATAPAPSCSAPRDGRGRDRPGRCCAPTAPTRDAHHRRARATGIIADGRPRDVQARRRRACPRSRARPSTPPASTLDDVDLFVYHQANARILKAVGERLELDRGARRRLHRPRRQHVGGVDPAGARRRARGDGRLRAGARVLLAAFGAGFTWGGGRRRVGDGAMSARAEGCALVTGASRGHRRRDARALAADGWPVGVNYRSRRRRRRGASSPRSRPPAARAVAIARRRGRPRRASSALFDAAEEALGPVLVLVNNAGVRADGLAPQIERRRLGRACSTRT